MATDDLSAESATNNPADEIYNLATSIQDRASMIRSLVDAIDAASDDIDGAPNVPNVSNIVNFSALSRDTVNTIAKEAERVELLAMRLRSA